jgi:hypothetical protein
MITVGLCLIYYGVALWGYQLYGWFADDEWIPYSVMGAWIAFFGRPDLSWPVIGPAIEWVMGLPLSLALILVGGGILCTITGVRQYARARLRRLRTKWVAEQASAAGYKPWTIPRAVNDFQKEVLDRETKGKTGYG